jgi:hypothetical protein
MPARRAGGVQNGTAVRQDSSVISPTMAKTPDSTLKELAARLDEIASLRIAVDRQFGKAAQNKTARRSEQPLRLVVAKPSADDGNKGSPE